MPSPITLAEDTDGFVTTTQAADYLDTSTQNVVGRFRTGAIEGEQPGGEGTTIRLKADSVRSYREKGGRRRGPKKAPTGFEGLEAVLDRIEARLTRLEGAITGPSKATDSQTALVIGLLGVADELRTSVEAGDEVSKHLAAAVQASLDSKSAMTRADRLRDEIVTHFAIPDELIPRPPG